MNHISKVLDSRVNARVVVGRGQLNELTNVRDGAIDAHVLVANDGFHDSLSLVVRGTKVQEYREGSDATVDIETHARGREDLFCSTNVMEEAGECPRRWIKCGISLGKLLLGDGHACVLIVSMIEVSTSLVC